MNIIQTFWTDNTSFDTLCGWISPEFHWMSWALSSNQLAKYYHETILYTNDFGEEILVKKLNLPYAKVKLTHNELDIKPTGLWVLPKLLTYSLQKEPFLHVDGDIYLWEAFPLDLFEEDIICQNIEKGFPIYYESLDSIKKLEGISNLNLDSLYSLNAGILGGLNFKFFQAYSSKVFEFVEKNSTELKNNSMSLNMTIEQFFCYVILKEKRLKFKCLFNEIITDPTYTGFARFESVPYATKFIHALGDFKKSEVTCHHLARRLRKDYPVVYYKIIELCLKNNQTLFWKCYPLQSLDEFWTQQYKIDVDNYAFVQSLFENEQRQIFDTKLKFNSCCKLIDVTEPTYSQLINYPDVTIKDFKAEELDSLSMVFLDALIEGNSILKSIELSAKYFKDEKIQNLSPEFIEICLNRVKEFVGKGILLES